eukprot:scaffold921_cov190-Ochromonas_danica.AAC.5
MMNKREREGEEGEGEVHSIGELVVYYSSPPRGRRRWSSLGEVDSPYSLSSSRRKMKEEKRKRDSSKMDRTQWLLS